MEGEKIEINPEAFSDGIKVQENGEISGTIDGTRTVNLRPTVAEAVKEMRRKAPPLRGNGLFRHPPDWTQEEINFIVDGLKKHVPLYILAGQLHCERHTLSRLVQNNPELRRLREDVYEDLWETTVYQTDRLMQAGTPSVVIAMWDRLGPKHGFGPNAETGESEGDGRIVMGIIPEEEVKKAEDEVSAVRGKPASNPGGVMTDPMTMALIEETVKDEVTAAVEASKPKAIEADSVEVGEAPYAEEETPAPNYGYIGASSIGDPWAAGADSPFAM